MLGVLAAGVEAEVDESLEVDELPEEAGEPESFLPPPLPPLVEAPDPEPDDAPSEDDLAFFW